MRWLKCLLALCVLLTSQLVAANSAHAASVYDDFFPTQSTTTLVNHIEDYYGMSCGSGLDDYAANWSEAMHTNNVYSSDPAHGIAMASFDTAVSGNGGWWVQYDQVNNGDNTSNPYFVTVFWADDASQWEQAFETNLNGDQYLILKRKAGVSSSVKLYMGFVGSSQLIQGSGGCDVEWLYGGVNSWTDYTLITKGSPSKLFLSTFTTVYPAGYAGPSVPSEYIPPTPALTHHTGTVDCMDTEPPAQMLIYQTGNNGSATLTVSSLAGKADWAYDFTDSPYHIAVLCGAKWTYSYGTVTEKNANWYCDPNGVYLKECELG